MKMVILKCPIKRVLFPVFSTLVRYNLTAHYETVVGVYLFSSCLFAPNTV